MKPTCVLTGATGLLGASVLTELADYEVFILGKNLSKTSLQANRHYIISDLNDVNFTNELPEKIDAVIHLAQSNHFREFPEKAIDIANVNTISTLLLLDYAKKASAKSFIYASSGTVYGSSTGPCLESQPLTLQENKGFYYASKVAAEVLVETYAALMKSVILRFFFIYGPDQKTSMLMPRLVNSVIDGKAITLQGSQGMHINPIYVTDAAKAVMSALKLKESGVFNVAGSEILSMRKIGEVIGEAVGIEPKFESNLSAPVTDLIADTKKMNELLYQPEVSFKDGIEQVINKLNRVVI